MLLYRYRSNLKLFLFWGVLCLLTNVICTAGTAYDGDQGYWADWVKQLMNDGFGGFRGNYPPLYVIWLWIVAQMHSLLNLAVGKTFLLKFVCLWPIYLSHLFLVDWLCRVVEKFDYPQWKKHLLLAFVALNPALLLDGPVWGQVDLFPVVIAAFSIYCISRPRYVLLASMLYVLSVLTKFQMIAFLPIFGGLFIRNWRVSWKGIPVAIVAAVLVLLPFIIGSNLQPMLTRAYVQTTSLYAYATYNGANLWFLLAGNVTPDNIPIWGFSEDGLGFLLKPINLGKILFVIVSVFTLVKSILCKNVRTAFALCTLNGLAFFILLPGMHERYLVCTVPMALCWLVWDMRRGGFVCLLVTLVAMLNVNLINSFRGPDVWTIVSFVGCVSLVIALFVIAAPKVVAKVICKVKNVPLPSFSPYVLLFAILFAELAYLAYHSRPIDIPLGDDVVLLTDLRTVKMEQGFKSPRYNQSIDGHSLTSGNRVYKYGIGAHAPSDIVFELPQNADTLFVWAGIDGECYHEGSAKFRIKVDEKTVWNSRLLDGRRGVEFSKVPLQGASLLELITDPNGSDNCDHTDWLNGYIKLR